MTFSQGWDAGFKTLLIYVGCVFFWLIFIEPLFADRGLSVWVMNAAAIALGAGFFLSRRRAAHAERARAEAEVAAILAGDA